MAIIFCVVFVFLSSIGLTFPNLENQYDKSAQLNRNYTKKITESNERNTTQNLAKSFGSETMRSVIKLLSKRKHSQEKMIKLYQTGLNNTASSDQSYIIFTKNAKTGSETVKVVISELSKKNNFTMVTANYRESILSEESRRYFFDLWKGSRIQHSTNGKYDLKIETIFPESLSMSGCISIFLSVALLR